MKQLILAFVLALLAPFAVAQAVPNSATLSWTPPTAHVDGTAITGALSYNVYQGVGVGSTKTKVGTVTTSGATINTGLLSNTTYCWQVTAFEGATGPESAKSNEGCKTFPASPPGAFTLTVQ